MIWRKANWRGQFVYFTEDHATYKICRVTTHSVWLLNRQATGKGLVGYLWGDLGGYHRLWNGFHPFYGRTIDKGNYPRVREGWFDLE